MMWQGNDPETLTAVRETLLRDDELAAKRIIFETITSSPEWAFSKDLAY
jgi:hypothetical protein